MDACSSLSRSPSSTASPCACSASTRPQGSTIAACPYVALGFDGARTDQNVPMRRTGYGGKGRRCGNQFSTCFTQGGVQLRETQVVADGQPQTPHRRVRDHHVAPMSIVVRLTVATATVGNVHIEQMQLVVARNLLTVFVDQ